MENKSNEDLMESPTCDVFEIPGEPAIVINGLPPASSSEANLMPNAITDSQSLRPVGFGEWLEGREVQKLFGDRYFNGKVVKFDEEVGWYRVVYEDGDFEDLEWDELKEVLVPLDVNIPLRTLAMKITKKKPKDVQKPGKSKVGD